MPIIQTEFKPKLLRSDEKAKAYIDEDILHIVDLHVNLRKAGPIFDIVENKFRVASLLISSKCGEDKLTQEEPKIGNVNLDKVVSTEKVLQNYEFRKEEKGTPDYIAQSRNLPLLPEEKSAWEEKVLASKWLEKCEDTYRRELPRLEKSNPGEFVAVDAEKVIEISPNGFSLLRKYTSIDTLSARIYQIPGEKVSFPPPEQLILG